MVMLRTKDTVALFLTLLVAVSFGGCEKFSEEIRDEAAGMNGSFEYTESGLPVNWLIYTPRTIPTGDYQLVIDNSDPKDGKHEAWRSTGR